MSSLLDDGINLFNIGRYFEAHEVWEDLWRQTHGELRLFYQALIQAAVGLHHLSKGNAAGARSQLSKSLSKLLNYADSTAGIDVVSLRTALRKVLDELDVGSFPQVRIARLKSKRDVVESDGTLSE